MIERCQHRREMLDVFSMIWQVWLSVRSSLAQKGCKAKPELMGLGIRGAIQHGQSFALGWDAGRPIDVGA